MAQDAPKGSPVQLAVIRNDNLGKGGITPEDDMAANLPSKRKTRLLKSLDAIPAGNDRQLGHTLMISA